MSRLHICEDDLTDKNIADLLREHLENMYEITPPKSVHALDIEALHSPDITFWTAWDGEELLGCGALKELDSRSGEIKSMRTRFWKVQIAVLSISEKLKMKFLRNI